jgi:hypothetical protein
MRSMQVAFLAVFLATVLAATSVAQLPDPSLSTVVLDPQSSALAGLMTCSCGGADPFEYIKITVHDSYAVPIPGLPASNFAFSVIGGNVMFYPAPFSLVTDPNGVIYFYVVATQSIPHPSVGGAPLEIRVSYYGYFLGAPVHLTCNSPNYDGIGTVGPIDFAHFAGDFGMIAERSDFTWSGGGVDPIDFSKFASHWGH